MALRDIRTSGGGPRCVWPAGAALGEGPLWVAEEHALYWVDILGSKLFRFEPASGSQQSWHLPLPVSALAACEPGGLACVTSSGVFRFDPAACTLTLLHPAPFENASERSNDGACDPYGHFWFGSMDHAERVPHGGFYRLTREGKLERVHGGIVITNGPAFDPARGFAYLVDTLGRTIWRADIDGAQGLGHLQPFVRLESADGYPDGLTVDAEGGVWCAHWGGGRVTRFSVDGFPDESIRFPVSNVTKCAFGGEMLDILYVTTARKGLDSTALAAEPLAGGLFAVAQPSYRGLVPAAFKPSFSASAPILDLGPPATQP